MNKDELRKSVLNIRRFFDGEKESLKICENVENMAEYKNANNIAVFMPYKSEVKITPLILNALKEKNVCFPVTDENNDIEFYYAKNLSELRPGKYGIMQPSKIYCANDIDFMIVPGIVFGKNGFRIGYGKGCYDRYLAGKNIFTCAVGYSFQLKDYVDNEAHDIAMSAFADENEVLYF